MKQRNVMELIAGAAGLFKKAFVKRELGVSALIIKEGKILLVEHTYKKGWSIVGGGVDSGEAPEDAAAREVYEEVGVKMKSPPEIFHLFHWGKGEKDSYGAVYLCTDFDMEEGVRSFEIKQSKWFDLEDLPKNLRSFSRQVINRYKEKIGKG
ncbi:MAG: NUDIX domain-containing protein [bacterium]|nr:NUDIX domain-containing protein [bacterium]